MNPTTLTEYAREGLEHLWDYSYLGKHPLSRLNCIKKRVVPAETVRLALGRAVSAILQSAIAQLKPDDTAQLDSRDARYYLILRYAFVERESADRVALRLYQSRRTFYRERLEAIRVVAEIVLEWEERADPPASSGSK